MDDDDYALSAALRSLGRATYRHLAVRDEAWKSTDPEVRFAHRWGGNVRAMLWARDRHYHQLPFSTESGTTPFFEHGKPGVMFYISPGLVWRSAEVLAARVDPGKRQLFRPDYEKYAQGVGTAQPCGRSRHVFAHIAETTDMLPEVPFAG